jgi:hypothetical protein
MTAILAALCATLFLITALLGWRRPSVFWPSVAGLAGCTLAALLISSRTLAPDFVVVIAFVLLGPVAVVLCLVRLRVFTKNLLLAVVTAVVTFVCAAAVWAFIAVSVGALAP